jgi:hypothetical protein
MTLKTLVTRDIGLPASLGSAEGLMVGLSNTSTGAPLGLVSRPLSGRELRPEAGSRRGHGDRGVTAACPVHVAAHVAPQRNQRSLRPLVLEAQARIANYALERCLVGIRALLTSHPSGPVPRTRRTTTRGGVHRG